MIRTVSLSLFALAPDGVYPNGLLPSCPVSSYLTFSPLPAETGGYFLRHFPWDHSLLPLGGILSCGARTFLYRELQRLRSPHVRLSVGNYWGFVNFLGLPWSLCRYPFLVFLQNERRMFFLGNAHKTDVVVLIDELMYRLYNAYSWLVLFF